MNDIVALLSEGYRVPHLFLSLGSALLSSPSKLPLIRHSSRVPFSLGLHTICLGLPSSMFPELQSPSSSTFFSLTLSPMPNHKVLIERLSLVQLVMERWSRGALDHVFWVLWAGPAWSSGADKVGNPRKLLRVGFKRSGVDLCIAPTWPA